MVFGWFNSESRSSSEVNDLTQNSASERGPSTVLNVDVGKKGKVEGLTVVSETTDHDAIARAGEIAGSAIDANVYSLQRSLEVAGDQAENAILAAQGAFQSSLQSITGLTQNITGIAREVAQSDSAELSLATQKTVRNAIYVIVAGAVLYGIAQVFGGKNGR